jgi:hypothetical protein
MQQPIIRFFWKTVIIVGTNKKKTKSALIIARKYIPSVSHKKKDMSYCTPRSKTWKLRKGHSIIDDTLSQKEI